MMRRYLPAILFIALLGVLAVGLTLKPRELPSPLVGKATPDFRLPLLDAPERMMTPADMRGQVWLLNVWASWCGACREEHPVLLQLSRMSTVPLYGLDYKDDPLDGAAWLARHGNPYRASLVDVDGRAGMDYGVYGVPETFVIDRNGVVRHKHVGVLTEQIVRDELLPLLAELEGEEQAMQVVHNESGE